MIAMDNDVHLEMKIEAVKLGIYPGDLIKRLLVEYKKSKLKKKSLEDTNGKEKSFN